MPLCNVSSQFQDTSKDTSVSLDAFLVVALKRTRVAVNQLRIHASLSVISVTAYVQRQFSVAVGSSVGGLSSKRNSRTLTQHFCIPAAIRGAPTTADLQ